MLSNPFADAPAPPHALAEADARDPEPRPAVTFTKGEPVPWPTAPGGIAQVEFLLRSRVGILWKDERGKVRRHRIDAHRLAKMRASVPPMFDEADVANPYGRGIQPERKAFL